MKHEVLPLMQCWGCFSWSFGKTSKPHVMEKQTETKRAHRKHKRKTKTALDQGAKNNSGVSYDAENVPTKWTLFKKCAL